MRAHDKSASLVYFFFFFFLSLYLAGRGLKSMLFFGGNCSSTPLKWLGWWQTKKVPLFRQNTEMLTPQVREKALCHDALFKGGEGKETSVKTQQWPRTLYSFPGVEPRGVSLDKISSTVAMSFFLIPITSNKSPNDHYAGRRVCRERTKGGMGSWHTQKPEGQDRVLQHKCFSLSRNEMVSFQHIFLVSFWVKGREEVADYINIRISSRLVFLWFLWDRLYLHLQFLSFHASNHINLWYNP